jgi:hypothetical protein
VPPTIINPNDVEFLKNSTAGVRVMDPGTTPPLVPGTTYFLGVQNTNSVAVTEAVEVTFLFGPPILPFQPNQAIAGGDTLVVTNTAIDGNPLASLNYVLVNPPAGATINNNGIITWLTPVVDDFTNYNITTIVTDTQDGLSATNSFSVFVLPPLSPIGPTTNTVPPGGIQWFKVKVPKNAIAASNILWFATLPVNLWYSTNVPPTITNSYDFELLTNATSGVSLLTTDGIPALVDNSVYYLGVQNTNSVTITNAIQVIFVFPVTPVFTLSITSTNIGGTNGMFISWYAPTNYQFHLQSTPSLLPMTWQNFKGVISYASYVTATNSFFSYFDDGSQTGGFGFTRFYRIQLLNSPTNTAPFFIHGTPPNDNIDAGQSLIVTNAAADYDLPAQILTYALQTDVVGTNQPAIDNHGVITWTPDITQTNSSNHFTTIVTDSGVPPKSVTNSFVVVVSTNVVPSFSSVVLVTNGVALTWYAPTNEQFNMHWATNLTPPIIWNMFPKTFTSTNGIFFFVDTNMSSAMKFYQLILLP